MKVNGKIIIDNRFHTYQAELDRAIVKSLGQAAGVGITAGRAKPTRYNLRDIQDKVALTPPIRIPGGWMIQFKWEDFRAHFFEKGTYQKLGRVLTARSRAGGEGNRGVRPQRFVAAARRAARVALVLALNRNLR